MEISIKIIIRKYELNSHAKFIKLADDVIKYMKTVNVRQENF